MITCCLHILSQPTLATATAGLQIRGPTVEVNEDLFPCCRGLGQYQNKTNDVVRCNLKERLARMEAHYNHGAALWGVETMSPLWRASPAAPIVHDLIHLKQDK